MKATDRTPVRVCATSLSLVGLGIAIWSGVVAPAECSGALFQAATNYSVGSGPAGIWLGNLRGKGTSRDMVVANSASDTVTVRLCLDNGAFGQANHYAVGLTPLAVRTANLNGDAYEDVIVANSGTNTVSVLINQGFGANFKAATNFVVGSSANPGPRAVTVADVDQDGKVDILVANFNDNSISVLRSLGGGVFGTRSNFTVGTGPLSIYAADFTGDTIVDVLTADSGSDTLTILPGLGNGDFGSAQTISLDAGSVPTYALPADFNGDDSLDIAVALQGSDKVRVLLFDAGNYVLNADYPVGDSPRSILLRDLNRDGYTDLVVANSGDDNLQVFLGSAIGAFSDGGTFGVGDNPAIVVGSNFNSDDAGDLAVANTGDGNVSVLLFGGPLAYNVTVSALEDTPKAIALKGGILGGGELIYITNSHPANGTLTGPTTNLVYLGNTNFFGADSFQYSTTDGTLTSAVATVTISVTPVNDAPSFSLTTNFISVLEDAAATNIVGFATGLSRGPANESAQTLAFVVTTTNTAFFSSRPYINPGGNLTFRPARNAKGTQTMSVRLRDSGGYLNGGTNLSETLYFSIEVRPNPIKPLSGTYSGLFHENGGVWHPSSGYFTFAMKSSGLFSGRLTVEGVRYSFTGTFDLSGYAQTQIPRNSTTLTVDMQLDLTNQTDKVMGTVTDGVWTADLEGDRVIFHSTTNPAPQAGKYTLVLPGDHNDASASPGGDTYATMTVNAAGVVRVNGKTGDAASFSQSSYLSKAGQWPFYAPLYSTRGSLLGWASITNRMTNSVEGDVSWIKTAFTTRYYPDGFTNQAALQGSTYVPPSPGQRVVGLTNALLSFTGGNLSVPLGFFAYLSETNTVHVGSDQMLRLNNPTTGLVAGQFVHPDLGVKRGLVGVVLQQGKTIRGYFTGYDQTGAVQFGP